MSLFKIASYVVLTAALYGCGFKPLYGSLENYKTISELANVKISVISERSGQELRNHLLDLMNPRGEPRQPSYRLSVSLSESKRGLALQKSEVSTRANLTIATDFTLIGIKNNAGKKYSGSSQIISSYNILNSDFATLAAEKNARSRAIKALSAEITNHIAAYIKSIHSNQ
ncbi:MAG: hypothetical protein VX617_05115 [Pseudomonadota bacterium]|nr:hypothetical protein [Pseudomonadota bacterium]